MELLEAKLASELHDELRIRLLERIVFINVYPIVIQIEERVPTQFRFQHAVDCKSCSDDSHHLNIITAAV